MMTETEKQEVIAQHEEEKARALSERMRKLGSIKSARKARASRKTLKAARAARMSRLKKNGKR